MIPKCFESYFGMQCDKGAGDSNRVAISSDVSSNQNLFDFPYHNTINREIVYIPKNLKNYCTSFSYRMIHRFGFTHRKNFTAILIHFCALPYEKSLTCSRKRTISNKSSIISKQRFVEKSYPFKKEL